MQIVAGRLDPLEEYGTRLFVRTCTDVYRRRVERLVGSANETKTLEVKMSSVHQRTELRADGDCCDFFAGTRLIEGAGRGGREPKSMKNRLEEAVVVACALFMLACGIIVCYRWFA